MNIKSNICCDLKDIRQSLSHASHILYNKKDNFDACNINALDYITKTLHTAQREIELKKECCLIIEEKKKLKEWQYTLDPEKRKKEEEIQKRKNAYEIDRLRKQNDEFIAKMNGVVNKTFIFELGGSAEYYINQIKEKFEYKEDEVFIMPDGTPIDPNLWLERRKWLVFSKKYHYNLNIMNTLARLVTIAALFKENKNKETVNSRENNVHQFEQQHGNVSESFFDDMFTTTTTTTTK